MDAAARAVERHAAADRVGVRGRRGIGRARLGRVRGRATHGGRSCCGWNGFWNGVWNGSFWNSVWNSFWSGFVLVFFVDWRIEPCGDSRWTCDAAQRSAYQLARACRSDSVVDTAPQCSKRLCILLLVVVVVIGTAAVHCGLLIAAAYLFRAHPLGRPFVSD